MDTNSSGGALRLSLCVFANLLLVVDTERGVLGPRSEHTHSCDSG